MSDLFEKPLPFKANANTLSARALNLMRDAIPRLITGGAGIKVSRSGGRVVIGQATGAGAAPGTAEKVTITELKNTYVLGTKGDGATIAVAKPWGLRRGVVFPTDGTYVYATAHQRTKTVGAVETVENLTPVYEVGEEILARRLVSTGITEDGDGPAIAWIDENTIGRWWVSTVSGMPSAVGEANWVVLTVQSETATWDWLRASS